MNSGLIEDRRACRLDRLNRGRDLASFRKIAGSVIIFAGILIPVVVKELASSDLDFHASCFSIEDETENAIPLKVSTTTMTTDRSLFLDFSTTFSSLGSRDPAADMLQQAPEPSAMGLLGIGISGLIMFRRFRRMFS